MPSQQHDIASELRRAIAASSPSLGDEVVGRAGYLLRSHVLAQLGEAVAATGVDALLVKGAALALTVYDKPWHRDMADVDVLVRPSGREQLAAAFERAGCVRKPRPRGRIWSHLALGETPLTWHDGSVAMYIEIHHMLDKLAPRPVDYEGIFARAAARPQLPGFLFPCAEDQALLVVLHAASSEFRHPVALVDLELLLRRGLDLETVERRARQWRLGTALFSCLSTLRALGSSNVPAELVERLEPGRLRRRAIARLYDVDGYPTARTRYRSGMLWVLRQMPLRDDLPSWVVSIGRYGAQRAAERSLGAFAAGRNLARRLGARFGPSDGGDG